MNKVLVTYPIPLEGLTTLVKETQVTYSEGKALTRQDMLSCIHQYDAVLAAGVGLDRELIDAAENLKIISVYGAGYDKVDVEYATQKGIAVANIPDAVTDATAEIAFGLMLSVMRRITECDRKLRSEKDFKWGMMGHLGNALYDKCLGIIGMGRIGKAVAKRADAFGMNVCYYSRSQLDTSIEKKMNVSYLPLDILLRQADILTIHTPLTKDTYHLIGSRELEMLKPNCYIINTARGAVIDEKALIHYLKEKRIAGAGLDVFEFEPVIPPELTKLDNVVITPHIGTETIETRIQMASEASKNILDFFRGEKPKYLVNPQVINK